MDVPNQKTKTYVISEDVIRLLLEAHRAFEYDTHERGIFVFARTYPLLCDDLEKLNNEKGYRDVVIFDDEDEYKQKTVTKE